MAVPLHSRSSEVEGSLFCLCVELFSMWHDVTRVALIRSCPSCVSFGSVGMLTFFSTVECHLTMSHNILCGLVQPTLAWAGMGALVPIVQ